METWSFPKPCIIRAGPQSDSTITTSHTQIEISSIPMKCPDPPLRNRKLLGGPPTYLHTSVDSCVEESQSDRYLSISNHVKKQSTVKQNLYRLGYWVVSESSVKFRPRWPSHMRHVRAVWESCCSFLKCVLYRNILK